jgi:phosphoglycolate phosphatase-like HAD superfamily hydrolase
VVCGDDVARGRPAPDLIVRAMAATGTADASVVANVGDTTMDLEAGHAAGVRWNVGVTSGAHDRARLERAPHTHLIASVADLPLQAFLRWT